jgi:hypothetical protein
MATIQLTQDYFVEFDDEDIPTVSKHKWFAKFGGTGGQPYAARSETYYVDGKRKVRTIRLHRQIMNCPQGMEVDHLDGNTMNCRKANLVVKTKVDNLKNRGNNPAVFDQQKITEGIV